MNAPPPSFLQAKQQTETEATAVLQLFERNKQLQAEDSRLRQVLTAGKQRSNLQDACGKRCRNRRPRRKRNCAARKDATRVSEAETQRLQSLIAAQTELEEQLRSEQLTQQCSRGELLELQRQLADVKSLVAMGSQKNDDVPHTVRTSSPLRDTATVTADAALPNTRRVPPPISTPSTTRVRSTHSRDNAASPVSLRNGHAASGRPHQTPDFATRRDSSAADDQSYRGPQPQPRDLRATGRERQQKTHWCRTCSILQGTPKPLSRLHRLARQTQNDSPPPTRYPWW